MLARGVVINLDFDPVTALKAIEKYKVTVMYGVPAMFERLLNVADFDKYDISSLNRVASVGAVLPRPTLEKMWDRISPNVYDHIGLQETGFVAVSKPDMKRKNPEYLGPPVPLQEIRIVDEQGKDKPLGEIGELIYRYPDGAGEYWKNPEKTKEAIRDGWFYSGDLGKVNEDGHLAVVGRTKDMIVSGAYNVFAIDVEEQIMKHPKVADCAVIGLPDKTWGEKVAAVIKLKSGETSTEEEMINYCKEMMSHYKAPKTVIFADVPRTASGKAVKFELVEKYKGK
jgi:fatty-acyl-CoA synthase/long-chain acyl-CoA synthetase